MTRRWHTHPVLCASGDTVSLHQARVVFLCSSMSAAIGLNLDGSDLIRAAMHHDAAEAVIGDIPAPAKRRFPKLAAAYAEAEREVMDEMGIAPFELADVEAKVLALCDKLDAYLWARDHGVTDADEWRDQVALMKRAAAEIGDDATRWLLKALSGAG